MATGAAFDLEQILAVVEDVGHRRHPVLVVALVAARLNVLLVIERPEPVLVTAVRLFNRGCASPITSVTGGAAELLRVVNSKKFLIGVRDECRLVSHILGCQLQGLAGA